MTAVTLNDMLTSCYDIILAYIIVYNYIIIVGCGIL